MKKYVFPVILSFLLFCPFRVESKQLYLKVAFGLFSGGNVTDSWQLNPEYYDYTFTQGEKTKPGLDWSLEFIIQLNRNISISLGTGYISRSLSGNAGQFILLDQTNEAVESFSCFPKLSSEMFPIYLTAILSFPLKPSVQLNFLGGMGYYLGNIKAAKFVEVWEEYYNPAMIANRLVWKFESKANALGFHAGAGIDMALPLNMYFFIETLYRAASFKKFKTSVQKIRDGIQVIFAGQIGETGEGLGEDSTFFYAQKIKDVEEQKDIDYRVSRFNYAGFTFRAGLKFKF